MQIQTDGIFCNELTANQDLIPEGESTTPLWRRIGYSFLLWHCG